MSFMLSEKKHVERLELYKQGLSDLAIANKLNTCIATINNWRKKNNLPANYPNTVDICRKRTEILFNEFKNCHSAQVKPWKDPESLFCGGEFLEKEMGVKVKKTKGQCDEVNK